MLNYGFLHNTYYTSNYHLFCMLTTTQADKQPNILHLSYKQGFKLLYTGPRTPSFSDHQLSVRLYINISIIFSSITGPITVTTKLGTKHPWAKGIQVCSNEGPRPFPRGDNNEIGNMH